MRRKKEKFRDNRARRNVLEQGKPIFEEIKGNWNEFFGNDNPLVLELACGYGEYTVGGARIFPKKNFIGVDIKGDRIWRGSSDAIDEQLKNTAFLRTQIELIDRFFEPDEVDGIWIVFPDPRPKKRDAKRRLTHHRFLDLYKQILNPKGTIRLKTDNVMFHDYTLEVLKNRDDIQGIAATTDLYNSPLLEECYGIKTRYEEKFISEDKNITYLRFKFRS